MFCVPDYPHHWRTTYMSCRACIVATPAWARPRRGGNGKPRAAVGRESPPSGRDAQPTPGNPGVAIRGGFAA
jgi:hypothetical protein